MERLTTPTDAPRPALGTGLGELARLATAVIEQNAAKNALPYGSQERNDANRVLLQLIVDFRAAATPEVVLQLVALATGGAETEAMDDALERDYGDLCSDLAAAQEALVLLANQLERHSVPFVPEAEVATAKARVEVARDRDLLARGMEAATEVIRANRALTPERPADAKLKKDPSPMSGAVSDDR
jgi:hypothetical protein